MNRSSVPLFLHGFHEHALRSPQRPDGAQPPFADAVVNRSPRNAEKLSSLVYGHAASELGLKTVRRMVENCRVHELPTSAVRYGRVGAGFAQPCKLWRKSLPVNNLSASIGGRQIARQPERSAKLLSVAMPRAESAQFLHTFRRNSHLGPALFAELINRPMNWPHR
jgi:hypothetical protein